MTGSNEKNVANTHDGSERRIRENLRSLFEQAYQVAYPLLHSRQSSQLGSSSHFLRITLHEAFPDLHQQDIAILAASVERVFRERSKSESQ